MRRATIVLRLVVALGLVSAFGASLATAASTADAACAAQEPTGAVGSHGGTLSGVSHTTSNVTSTTGDCTVTWSETFAQDYDLSNSPTVVEQHGNCGPGPHNDTSCHQTTTDNWSATASGSPYPG